MDLQVSLVSTSFEEIKVYSMFGKKLRRLSVGKCLKLRLQYMLRRQTDRRINRNINHSSRCHCSNFNLRAPNWQHQRRRRQTKTHARQDERHKTHTHTAAYATCSAAATPFRRPPLAPLPALPPSPFSLLNSCRCYWDKKIYWLRMFFVTDFDLCAFYMFAASIFYLNSSFVSLLPSFSQRMPAQSENPLNVASNERGRDLGHY